MITSFLGFDLGNQVLVVFPTGTQRPGTVVGFYVSERKVKVRINEKNYGTVGVSPLDRVNGVSRVRHFSSQV